ncbi:MAG: hypothetical protein ABR499_01690 [Gemmatimonadaceae bacterium]
MHSRRRRWVRTAAAGVVTALTVTACVIVRHQRVEVEALDPRGGPIIVQTPVKAHLRDGSTVVYPQGVSLVGGALLPRVGTAKRYDVALRPVAADGPVPIDSVVGMENYTTKTNHGTSIALTTLSSTVATIGAIGLAVAIFGSCPTIYADSAGTPVLQAEVFANRISPLFEARDIDRLSATANERGLLQLEVRNEALETHYINHLELLEIRHAVGEFVVPDERGRALAVRSIAPVAAARDRAGRDLTRTLRAADGDVFVTDSVTLRRATADDPRDYIDLAVARPAGSDSVAVVLNLRNSLLNSVLLYDMMLGAPGLRSLDWLAHDLTRIGPVLALGRWYNSRFGLRVLVREQGGQYRQVARHPTYGPVAWREVASVVPVPRGVDSVRIRLSFIADEWRIDRASIAPIVRRTEGRVIPAAEATESEARPAPTVLAHLRRADDRYLQTSPGQRFWLRFDAGAPPARDSTRTFFIASQGYYTEWVRGSWIKGATRPVPFAPTDSSLVETLRRWSAVKDSVDRHFYATRIPVR